MIRDALPRHCAPLLLLWLAAVPAARPQEVVRPVNGGADQERYLRYSSLEMLVAPDSFIQFMQSPEFHRGEEELRATWAVVWFNRQKMERLAEAEPFGPVEAPPSGPGPEPETAPVGPEGEEEPLFPNVFNEFARSGFSGLASEMYLEGPVEVFVGGERLLLADAVYIDLVGGHGWIANVTATAKRRIGSRIEKLQVRADWMRQSADGSLRADSAIVTTGDFEDSSLSISTGDLRIRPTRAEEPGAWEFQLHENRIHLLAGIWLPLPSLTFNTEQTGKPILETFGFGDSARLGSFIQATFNRDMGGAGRTLNDLFDGDPQNYDAHYGFRGSFLGSRGVLGDLSVEIESEEHYWLRFHYAAVYDDAEDRGLVRVDPSERPRWRRWARARGRYRLADGEWVQLRFSHQSDPGVQAEFFERDYLHYERRDNDVVWRKALDQDYFSASARVRLEDFRTDVAELPELRFHRGATDVATVLGRPLLYRADATAGYLQRREGDPEFEAPFADGLGDHDVVRIAATQRLSLPFRTGLGGLRAIPFVEGIARGWDRAAQEEEEAGRAALVAGVELATHLWRTAGSGTLRIAPFVGLRADVAHAETDAVPVRFDELEDPVEGTVASAGARTLWSSDDGDDWVDLQLRASRVEDRDDAPDGWRPLEAFLAARALVGDIPFGLFHDGRYSLDGGGTLYSLTDVGARLTPDLTVEVGHRRARDAASAEPLFESAALGARYRWTEKWELEGRHEISLFDGDRLEDLVVIRRFGYDLVTDISISFRAGEGTSVGFRIQPTIVFDGSDLGVVRTFDY